MPLFLEQNWPWLLGAVLLILLILLAIALLKRAGGRSRVDMSPPLLDEASPAPTLARARNLVPASSQPEVPPPAPPISVEVEVGPPNAFEADTPELQPTGPEPVAVGMPGPGIIAAPLVGVERNSDPEPVQQDVAAQAPDDLTRMKGVGPKLVTLLTSLGVTRFEQIAGWTERDIADINRHLGGFAGRIERDRWVEQARFLAAGDIAGYEVAFGKLDGVRR